MREGETRKQVSIFLPISDWRELRKEAARQRVPMTELCRQWLQPHMERLHRRPAQEWELESPDGD